MVLTAVLALAGIVALAAAAAALRSLGPGYRTARLLRAAMVVPVSEATRMAAAGERRYVKVTGRIRSDEEFPDENDRPLVFRRRRVDAHTGDGRWRVLEDERFAVPFGVEDRGAYIGVEVADLDVGLVVLTRESVGRAGDAQHALQAPLPADATVRLRVDQVSAVELATVAGVPVRTGTGETVLAAGLGRPLVVTTLEANEAMRVLAAGRRDRVVLAAACVVAGAALLVAAGVALLLAVAVPAAAQSPSPGLFDPADTRSEGEGPGVVGAPILVAVGVLALGSLAAAATALYVRLTRRD